MTLNGFRHTASTLSATSSGWRLRGLALIVLIVGVAATALFTSIQSSASTTLPGPNGKVAFVVGSYRNSCSGIGVATRRRRVRMVVPNPCEDEYTVDLIAEPSFSPNGRRIVYTEGEFEYKIKIVHVRSGRISTPRLRLPTTEHPAFLANGRIVFVAYSKHRRKVGTYVMRPDGSKVHRLFKRREDAAAPNGRWFISIGGRSLLLLDRRGRKVRRLVRLSMGTRVYWASFSPHGRWITFVEEYRDQQNDFIGTALFMVRRDGKHLRRLPCSGICSGPVFSPNGRWIAYSHEDEDDPSGRGRNILAVSVRHPNRTRAITRVSRWPLGTPAWGRR